MLFLAFRTQCGLKVGVLGGGAAGYFAAIQCAEAMKQHGVLDGEVQVFEGTKEVLTKVLISGGGRCNVQHDPSKAAVDIAKGYPRGQRELLGPLSKSFGPMETRQWFESKGVKLKTEPDGRVFPTTDKSLTIKIALEDAARSYGCIKINCNSRVLDVAKKGDKDKSFVISINTNDDGGDNKKKQLYFDRVIAATGSSRQGHDMMASLGHSIVQPLPSLFSFKINDGNFTQLSGLSTELSEVKLVIPKEFSKNNKALLR